MRLWPSAKVHLVIVPTVPHSSRMIVRVLLNSNWVIVRMVGVSQLPDQDRQPQSDQQRNGQLEPVVRMEL